MQEIAKAIESKELQILVKVGENDKLFGSVTLLILQMHSRKKESKSTNVRLKFLNTSRHSETTRLKLN